MFGQSACSAKRSIAVSSRADDAIAPAFVAPMARESAIARSRALPVPSCSDETKQGKPLPFTYRLRTDDPIMLHKRRNHMSGESSQESSRSCETYRGATMTTSCEGLKFKSL